jgi:hypothetical protein
MVLRKNLGYVAVLFLGMTATASFAQPIGGPQAAQSSTSEPHNGHWWGKKSIIYKEGFVTGYHAGLSKGTPGHPTDMKGLGSQELVEGLNKFYGDFRNTKILVDDALGYVVQEVQGTPDDKLAAMLLKMRQAAAGRGDDQ